MPGRTAHFTLLSVTVLGTMCNNIVNVPLRSIATDLRSSLAAAVLCVSAFVLVLAIAMPVSGWLGDRIGQKQALAAALLLMLVAQALAVFAPNLATLIGAPWVRHGLPRTKRRDDSALTAMLLVPGFGMAMVQTPAADGATSSPPERTVRLSACST